MTRPSDVQVDFDGVLHPTAFEFSALLRLGGVQGAANRSFSGGLDELRFHGSVLSEARIEIEYAAQLEGFATVGEAEPL